MNCYLPDQGLNQVEYTSDSGSDGYYSYKKEATPYKDPECQQKNPLDELFKVLAQERNKIREVQKKTEIQLELMMKLAALVIEHLTNPFSSIQEDEVLAVTLRSERQLEKSPPIIPQAPLETPKGADYQRVEKKIQDMPEAVITTPNKMTTKERRPTPLPYPTSTRKKCQAKRIDLQIVELLKKVEVTLPLLEVIR
ncbi:hypothetical protein PIB30_030579 [Stylosanthes scabra]|uniref:Uncharacterized protein n=1 Tax=Stylosanthes scabra TaxID=79078 RepID=A0ABU6TBC9_9FABA|nr:hypothetical protein [Stylosanthes scabra]